MHRKWFLKLLSMGSIGATISYDNEASAFTKLLKPKRLQRGDTIGLLSPASRLPRRSQYHHISQQIRKLGYNVKVGDHARNQYGYLAGTDEERAEDINTMFADDSIDAIIPFRGGWGSNRILPLLDYDAIRQNPKILVGFSDITSLLLSIYAKTGLVTFHGPVGKSDWTEYTRDHFQKVLSAQQPVTLKSPEKGLFRGLDYFSVITPGRAKGRLLGGNLSVLTAMIGSDYLPDWDNNILFLEDVGENIYRIDRMLTQLKLSGILDRISGFIFGQCTNCERANTYGLTLRQVFDDHIRPLNIPAFSGAMFGHLSNMVTLPVGLPAEMDARSGTIRIPEAATEP